ncbi:undecaprenyl-diphosphate phosphatase [Peribacillus frigoritolerans]|jgi:undecaprenyl-diphosphatase|uniref:undecaprenyl-diphosphate phosphatase n=1 Tax=Peribacillus TaxID=2675229 RepID=UPI0006AC8197|nr:MULTISPECIES: undecaprenyl-diphosphate phosphatase [Peribacillus]KOR80852.1 UDP pyrophosphate phosphatase [Bacillus sp. FJAT-21352]KOR85461.1 UDP pyrophosphate phosphatase [Bacillus sp. FJAT-22058]AZV62323.1 undecaprenyl-diphosphate phosphatase [Peribacillus frigoritolerans]MDM5308757.1 undecaprenyl-diphosphate phosphatase [Peribacillus frigoritolerans]MED4688384.1 undecaprenyl-diphosphate phosphatase [Peribacillus frigoritolerans]
MNMWEIFVAVILGLVEGLTEFAPVSSTGHMIIVDDLWLNSKELFGSEVANAFKVVIQLGSILAVVVLFWGRFMDLLGLRKLKGTSAVNGQKLNLLQIIVGLLPAGVLGLLFEDYIDDNLFTMKTVIVGLFLGAFLMIAADKFRPKLTAETVDQITYKQAFGVGLIQCLSLWPGFSRSGSTISGGVLLGMSYRAASDFTFIMAVPIMAGASLLKIVKYWDSFTPEVLPFFIAGFISAFIFALFCIRFFLILINKVKLTPFAIYRIVLAVVLLFIIW